MASADAQISIQGFTGLNLENDPRAIDDAELSELINFNVSSAGELVKRKGFVEISSGGDLGNSPVEILGHLLTSSYSQLIVKAGDDVYYSNDGISYTSIGTYSDAEFGLQYDSKFYIIRSGNEIVEWDGAAASAISGSPSGTFAIIHKERMFVINSVATGSLNSRYHFSLPGDVTASGWVGTNFIDVQPGDGDFLVAMAVVQDLLLIFKGRTTWALYIQGLTTDWNQRQLSGEVGCISKHSLQFVNDYLYFSSESDVIRTDGATFESISGPLGDILDGRIINLTTYNRDSFAYWEDKLICLIAPDDSTRRYFVYHFRVDGWSQWEFAGGLVPGTFLEVRTNTPQVGLYAGDLESTGKVVRLGSNTYKDAGSNYTCSIRTKRYDFGSPNNMKRGKWLGVEAIGEGTINYSHEVDGTEVDSGSVSSVGATRNIKTPGPGYFRTWLLELSVTSANAFTLLGLLLQTTAKRTVIKTRT